MIIDGEEEVLSGIAERVHDDPEAKWTLAMEWYIDFFLNGLLQQRREEHLRAEIDRALDDRDKKTFMKLSKELTSIVGL